MEYMGPEIEAKFIEIAWEVLKTKNKKWMNLSHEEIGTEVSKAYKNVSNSFYESLNLMQNDVPVALRHK